MLRRAIILSLVLSCLAPSVHLHAAEKADIAALMPAAMASLRAAASYARTGNIGLAQIELDDARRAWARLGGVTERAVAPYSDTSLAGLIAGGNDRLGKADAALTAGDGARAAADIAALRESIHAVRRDAGVIELSDCVFALAPVMTALRNVAVRFASPKATPGEVGEAGAALRAQLQRCNGLAAPDVASQAEFRRLIDGAIASAQEIGRAAHAGDVGLVHRYEIELQSFVNLLDFRYG
ncbi:conserved exported protein of unknown function [Bradyrhizobium sp. ORS 285]|uniref:hypothetical protein n=1 Tax=Bradyrhizobium sp. ORS 285 TaxID=115808 RepID=UPI0002406DD2|nr:hypothetical protein [Bradyrhizobium sp. ORS 285]CCD88968.1 conserved exported hypothetical protein [Bradyrhizobium sp. ORS 285]SMX57997.1 conserved exported protein of unknown function [Bradyrhizobium sp. ORS 285]